MKSLTTAALAALLLSGPAMAENTAQEKDGGQLFAELCMNCHIVEGQPTVAPPVFGVINHVKPAFPEREAFIRHITDWVANPDADNALMPGAVRRFGLMPKLGFADEDVRKIAGFLYDSKQDLPAWYKEHYRAEHGTDPAQ